MAATLTNKFAKKTAPAAPVVKKSIYAGIKADEPREAMPPIGTYTLRVIETVEGYNQKNSTTSFKTRFEVVEVHELGADVAVGTVFMVPFVVQGSKAADRNRSRVKSMVMAIAGFETHKDYDEFDPDGLFIEACKGDANDFHDQVAERYEGRLVLCQVGKGNLINGGPDYYREYAWATVDEQ